MKRIALFLMLFISYANQALAARTFAYSYGFLDFLPLHQRDLILVQGTGQVQSGDHHSSSGKALNECASNLKKIFPKFPKYEAIETYVTSHVVRNSTAFAHSNLTNSQQLNKLTAT